MSMPTSDDDMSLREIARTLADFRHEFRNQVAQLVRTDVYRAEREADRARIAALEKMRERDDEDKTSSRRQTNYAITAAVLSFIGSLLLVLLTR